MARPLYSTLIASEFPQPAGTLFEGGPPAGFLWIVRDIDALAPSGGYLALEGIQFIADGLIQFAGTGIYEIGGNHMYQWRGRQVIEEEGTLQVVTLDNDWSFRISGYVLSTT